MLDSWHDHLSLKTLRQPWLSVSPVGDATVDTFRGDGSRFWMFWSQLDRLMLGEVSNGEASKKIQFNPLLKGCLFCQYRVDITLARKMKVTLFMLTSLPQAWILSAWSQGCRMVWCWQSCQWWWRWRPRLRLIQDVMYTSSTWPFHCYNSLHLRTLSSAWSLVCTSHCTVSLPKRWTGTRTRQLHSSLCSLWQQNCGNYVAMWVSSFSDRSKFIAWSDLSPF